MCGEPLAVDDNVKDLELIGMNLPVNSSALSILELIGMNLLVNSSALIFLLCVSQ